MINIKKQLYNICETFLLERESTLHGIIEGIQNDLHSETKSSAGDKHETGRAMLQLEREKAGKQFSAITKQKELLAKVNLYSSSNRVRLGSLIHTTNGVYFLAISKGMVSIDNTDYYIIAPQSPIGKLLLGKQINDSITFNGKIITITQLD